MRYLVLFAAVCGVGSAALFAKEGLATTSPISLAAWRLTVAVAVLQGWRAFHKSEKAAWSKEDKRNVALAGVFLALHFASWTASLCFVSVARSTLLVSTSPFWAGLGGLLIPSLRVGNRFWIGFVLAVVGIWAVTTQGLRQPHQDHAWIGDALALIGAICMVPYLALSQSVQKSQDAFSTITWLYTAACGALWILALATKTASVPLATSAWISILGMAVLAQLIGHSGLNLSLKSFSPGQVAMATLLEPVFAAALAWPLLGEQITLAQGFGAVSLLAGVGLAII